MKTVEKPWGKEVWFAHTDKYVGKLIYILPGKRLSLQLHKVKDETLCLLDGDCVIRCGDTEVKLTQESEESIRITPETVHRIASENGAVLVEVSTPEVDDVVRLEDDYGRIPEIDSNTTRKREAKVGRKQTSG